MVKKGTRTNGNLPMKASRKKLAGKNKVAPDDDEGTKKHGRDVSDALNLMDDSQQAQTSNSMGHVPEQGKQQPAVLTDQEYLAAPIPLEDNGEAPQDCWAWLLRRPPPPPKPWCHIRSVVNPDNNYCTVLTNKTNLKPFHTI